MKAKMEQFPAMSPNPVLNVANVGVIRYSNEAGEPLLNEWGVKVGEKLPSHVEELVQTVISKNSSEKTEVKVGNRTYLIVFSPLPKQELVSISGFDISDRKELEEKTRENEEKYRTLFNSIDEGFCLVEVIIDDTGKPVDLLMLDYNSVFQQKTGFRFDIKGKNVRSVLTVYEEQWFDTIGEVALTGKSVRFENYFQSLNRWYSSFATRIGGEGSFRVAIIFDDITVRKLAEEALLELKETLEEKVKERTTDLEKAYNLLKDSEKRLAEAQEMAHIGNWEWDIATDKAYWSEEMYRIFKRDPQKMAPSLKEYYSYIHPDDLDYYCKATDYTRKVSTSGFDFRIVLANGEERTLHMKSDFIFEKNTPIRVKGIVQDITESKNAEEKIRYLANIVESSPDAIGTISLDGIITSWNKGAERIYGYSTEEILGKHVSILAPSHLENETMKLIELITHGESYYHYETLRLGKNGREIYVSITYSPILDTNGKLIAISIIGRDITERKKSDETLRNFEIAQKKEIHHRIKNNLQVIYSLLDLQAEMFKGRKTISDSEIQNAFKESMDRVLSISLIHEELYKGNNVELLNFSQYIQELVENLILTFKLETDISFNFDLEENIFLDTNSSITLGLIINELITNSFKYAFPGRDKGEIRIKLYRDVGECKKEGCKSISYVLSVSDDGIGIPGDLDIENLDSLGLQLVTTLVDQLDGELELKRDNGTEFTVRFAVQKSNNPRSAGSLLQLVDND